MDYKYIEQLLESYWKAETSVEEEKILHAFFSQTDIPEHLLKYRDLFTYGQNEKNEDVLGDDFDARLLAMTEQDETVKARKITIAYRMRPLFKAAAVVAILLTLGRAAQEPYHNETIDETTESSVNSASSVAATDSSAIDTLKQEMPTATILK